MSPSFFSGNIANMIPEGLFGLLTARSGFFRQNISGYALGVLTSKASPSGWVFSQAQQPMIKTYNEETAV